MLSDTGSESDNGKGENIGIEKHTKISCKLEHLSSWKYKLREHCFIRKSRLHITDTAANETAILLALTPRKPDPSLEKKFYMSIFTVQKR